MNIAAQAISLDGGQAIHSTAVGPARSVTGPSTTSDTPCQGEEWSNGDDDDEAVLMAMEIAPVPKACSL